MPLANGVRKTQRLTSIRILPASSCCIFQPFASSTLGVTSVFQGRLPHRLCASSSPRSSPGTPTERPPNSAFIGSLMNIVVFEAAGAVSRKSIVHTSEDALGEIGGIRTVMNPPPPIPDLRPTHAKLIEGGLRERRTHENMLTTPMHNVVLMAASTAFPPCFIVFTPISEHNSFSLATAPRVASTMYALLRVPEGTRRLVLPVSRVWRERPKCPIVSGAMARTIHAKRTIAATNLILRVRPCRR